MLGYDQDWAAFASSSVTATQARGIAEAMELHGYHMAPLAPNGSRTRNVGHTSQTKLGTSRESPCGSGFRRPTTTPKSTRPATRLSSRGAQLMTEGKATLQEFHEIAVMG
jgi:predicted CoA-binding protein